MSRKDAADGGGSDLMRVRIDGGDSIWLSSLSLGVVSLGITPSTALNPAKFVVLMDSILDPPAPTPVGFVIRSEGLGSRYPNALLSRTIHMLHTPGLVQSRIDRLIILVITTMYITMICEKNTAAFLGDFFPNILHCALSDGVVEEDASILFAFCILVVRITRSIAIRRRMRLQM